MDDDLGKYEVDEAEIARRLEEELANMENVSEMNSSQYSFFDKGKGMQGVSMQNSMYRDNLDDSFEKEMKKDFEETSRLRNIVMEDFEIRTQNLKRIVAEPSIEGYPKKDKEGNEQNNKSAMVERHEEKTVENEKASTLPKTEVIFEFAENKVLKAAEEEALLQKEMSKNKVELKNEGISSKIKELERRKELMRLEDERINMEREDRLSMEFEIFTQREKFKLRLEPLPSFRMIKEQPSAVSFSELTFPALVLNIPEMLEVKEENMAPKNSKEVCEITIRQLQNKKRPKLVAKKETKTKEISKRNSEISAINQSFRSLLDFAKYESEKLEGKAKISVDYFSEILKLLKIWTKEKLSALKENIQKLKIQPLLLKNANAKKTNAPIQINKNAIKITDITDTNFGLSLEEYEEEFILNQDTQRLGTADKKETKSLESLLKNYSKEKLLEMTVFEQKLENIEDISAVEKMPNLNRLLLSVNKITSISKNIEACKYLTEIHITQNKITDYSVLGCLSELRYLNLEYNQIESLCPLKNCLKLELLNLNENKIKTLDKGLGTCPTLRKLQLFGNKIASIVNFDYLPCLEELDLGKNQLKTLDDSILRLPLLKKLIIYKNLIEKLPDNFTHLLLYELWLNNNKLKSINNNINMPALEYLNLDDNQIEYMGSEAAPFFLPSLKKISLKFNKLSSIVSVFNILSSSRLLASLAYQENPFMASFHEDIDMIFTHYIFALAFPRLEELNGDSFYAGFRTPSDKAKSAVREFEDKYEVSSVAIELNRKMFWPRSSFVNTPDFFFKVRENNRESSVVFQAESRKFTRKPPYMETNEFKNTRLELSASHLASLVEVISSEFKNENKAVNLFLARKSQYEYVWRRSLHIIKSFLLKIICQKRKRKRFLLRNISKIIKIQSFYRGFRVRNALQIRNVLKVRKFRAKAPYAIKIQKVFRGWRLRMRMKKLMANIKYKDSEIDELEEYTDDFFEKEKELDLNLKIPDNFNIQEFFLPASSNNLNSANKDLSGRSPGGGSLKPLMQHHESSQDRIQKGNMSQHTAGGLPPIIDRKKPLQMVPTLQNNSGSFQKVFTRAKIDSRPESLKGDDEDDNKSTISLSVKSMKNSGGSFLPKIGSTEKKSQKTDEKTKKFIEEWGFNNEQVKMSLAFKLEKERKRRENGNKKKLTAEERYQQFLKASKK